jgi:hypothetical protein
LLFLSIEDTKLGWSRNTVTDSNKTVFTVVYECNSAKVYCLTEALGHELGPVIILIFVLFGSNRVM